MCLKALITFFTGMQTVQRPTCLQKGMGKMDLSSAPTNSLQASYASEGSCSPDLKATGNPLSKQLLTPVGPPTKAQSPIDMLPPGHPLPEAFQLAVQQDKRKEKLGNEPKYENVAQVTQKLQESNLNDTTEINFPSDKRKLAEIERYEQSFNAPPVKSSVSKNSSGTGIHVCKTDSVEKNDDYQFASDPDKLAQLEDGYSKAKDVDSTKPDYVNITGKMKEGQEFSFDDGEEDEAVDKGAGTEQAPAGSEFVDNFDKELSDIQKKADKENSSMMGIFDQLAEEKRSIDYDDDYDYEDGDYVIQWQLNDDPEDSETSTITESINNDLDSFPEDALFGQGPKVGNTGEKISNNSMEARLELHQSKLCRYQEMINSADFSFSGSSQQGYDDNFSDNDGDEDDNDDDDDTDEMQERSAHGEKKVSQKCKKDKQNSYVTVTPAVNGSKDLSLPAEVNKDKNSAISDNLDNTVKGHSLPASLGQFKGQGQVKGKNSMYVNQKTLKLLQQRSQREASEGECSEYV